MAVLDTDTLARILLDLVLRVVYYYRYVVPVVQLVVPVPVLRSILNRPHAQSAVAVRRGACVLAVLCCCAARIEEVGWAGAHGARP